MQLFIDDSGDPGFKFGSGSSDHLVIAGCLFKSEVDVEITSQAINEVKASLNLNKGQELKFSNSRDLVKSEFFSRVVDLPFQIRAVAIDKRQTGARELLSSGGSLFDAAVEKLIHHSGEHLLNARVYLDGRAGRERSKQIQRRLKSITNFEAQVVGKVKFVDSKANNLIQLADMVAGGIRKDLVVVEVDGSGWKPIHPLIKRPGSTVWMI
mgnify:CR=1 FL=1